LLFPYPVLLNAFVAEAVAALPLKLTSVEVIFIISPAFHPSEYNPLALLFPYKNNLPDVEESTPTRHSAFGVSVEFVLLLP
jgi:hypothetical protein